MWTIHLQRLSKIRTFSFGKGEKGRWGSSRLFLLFTIDLCENWPAKLPFPANDSELETSPVLVPFPKFKTLPIAQRTRGFSGFANLITQTTSCDQIISSSTTTTTYFVLASSTAKVTSCKPQQKKIAIQGKWWLDPIRAERGSANRDVGKPRNALNVSHVRLP